MESRQIVVKGLISRYYLRQPQGSGQPPAALFLHGWRSEGKVWQETMRRLGEEGITSFAIDLPGFGTSEAPRQSWRIDDYCGWVEEFVQRIGLERVNIIGHSFGGRVAIKLAAHNPAYLEKLTLVGSHGFRDDSWMRKAKLIAAKIVKPLFVPPLMQPLRKKIYSLMGAEDYLATPALQGTFLNVINEDLTTCMSSIRKPVCLIWGSEDKATPVSFGRRMEALMRDARLRIIREAGHYSFLDKPAEFANILIPFLRQ